jgi:hypothetical protein|eukprot:COSAG06_NODE_372_length_16686_cov_16.467354_2_plen_267_part_00
MEHELSPTLAAAEGTPPEQPGLEHGSSIEEQLEDAKTRAQQWQMKRVGMEYENTHHPTSSNELRVGCGWHTNQNCCCLQCCYLKNHYELERYITSNTTPTAADTNWPEGPLPVLPDATKPFPIDVTDLTGATIKVEASLDTSVDALRALVHDQTGVDPDLQMLLLDNEIPMEDETLALGAYGLRRGLRIQLTPQDPTKAAMRRRLRHEGRKAAELAKRRATQKKMERFDCAARGLSCAAGVVGIVLLIMVMSCSLVTCDRCWTICF